MALNVECGDHYCTSYGGQNKVKEYQLISLAWHGRLNRSAGEVENQGEDIVVA